MINTKRHLAPQKGVTLVELMISMTVFSMMLLIIVKGILGVVKVQQSGVVSRNTQQNTRTALEEIVREARSASDARVLQAAPLQKVCLVTAGGLVEYYVNTIDNRLYRATVDYNSGFNPAAGVNTCVASPTFTSNTAITSSDVAVIGFTAGVTPPPATSGSPISPPNLNLSLSISTNPPTATCAPGPGAQFCSITSLSSTVSLRGTP